MLFTPKTRGTPLLRTRLRAEPFECLPWPGSLARARDGRYAVEHYNLFQQDQEMSRKPRSVLLSSDAGLGSEGIPAATVERSDRAGKQMLGGYIERVAHERFRELACELHKTNADWCARRSMTCSASMGIREPPNDMSADSPLANNPYTNLDRLTIHRWRN